VNLGLLLLRLLVAALIAGHSFQKLLGWFGGTGFPATAAVFETWGFRPGRPMVAMAGASELTGVTLLALGLLTPLGAAVVIGTMVVAAAPNLRHGMWAHLGGIEVPVVYAGIAAVLAFTGPGRFSVDQALGLHWSRNPAWALAAIALAVIAAVPPLVRRHHALARTTTLPAGSAVAPAGPSATTTR
jgi:putative oxidoreductase